jgi:hypothetical protein
MDNIIGILITLLNSEKTDEQLLTFIRDHQTELVELLIKEHKQASIPNELQLCEFDELFAEMKARTKTLLVAAEFDRKHTTKVAVHYGGGMVGAMGLVQYAKRELEASQDDADAGNNEPFDIDNSVAALDEDDEDPE